ncbi:MULTISPECIES: hypothetical protein [unclassified Paracoccus (in: a-proteobacteria)]|uniref:hypothetical protein n=1 Tax=unclassified Paracoccus (in: a-proteobacteria) TaxID=2688777 RepID=UPI0016048E61|nr:MULTISPECIES: hypothetical protein [unclassified Paracoccus (in: a-proteobacteria)]MBB1491275.1 hypothetical protein [Paracoccus sp. MC1854]MBB1498053.1 hypothetical protein [Paracoccus sp. MC1862]
MDREEQRIRAAGAPAVASDRSYVDWGAILAGAVVAAALSVVFAAFGAGVGLGSISARAGEGLGFGSVILTGLFVVVTMVLSYMAGGYIAGRMRRRVDGASPEESAARDGIHGLAVWGIGTIFGAIMLASAIGSALNAAGSAAATAVEATGSAVGGIAQGVGAVAGGAVQGAGQLVGGAAQALGGAAAGTGATAAASGDGEILPGLPNPIDYVTDNLLRSEAAAPDQFSNEAIRSEVGNIMANVVRTGEITDQDRAYLESAIAARTTLSQPEVSARIDQAVGSVQQLRADAQQAVDQAQAEAQRLRDEAAAQAEQLRQQAVEAAETARRAGVLSAFALAASALIAAAAAFIGAQKGGKARDEGRIWGGLTHRPLRPR